MLKFLHSSDVWSGISKLAKTKAQILAASPYFGKDGATMMPLKEGDVLVVDLSDRAVSSGVTNPSELLLLYGRGVHIFNHQRLHAKVFVTNKSVIVGSANVSANSRDRLEEAVIHTDDSKIISEGKRFIEGLMKAADGMVSKEFLQIQKKKYRAPTGFARHLVDPKMQQQVSKTSKSDQEQRLWIVNGLYEHDWSDFHLSAFERLKKRIKVRPEQQVNVDAIIYKNKRAKWAEESKSGDIFIGIYKEKNKTVVYQPQRFLRLASFIENSKKRHMVFYEEKPDCKSVSYSSFIKALRIVDPSFKGSKRVKTRFIDDPKIIEAIREIW